MFDSFNDQARRVLARADEKARRYCHDFVGTEHVLLAIVDDRASVAASVLDSLGASAEAVRLEIEQLIQSGPEPATERRLPLTPRTQLAIEFAAEEARNVDQASVGAEHLLLGLLREPDGVAAVVLRKLGLKLELVREAVLRVRMEQLKIVERAVRPVRAPIGRKRKMREELLAHLTAIFDEEQARLSDPVAALDAAARRFGDPAELAQEIGSALTLQERISYFTERWFAWRAPESAARYSWRLAVQMLYLLASVLGVVWVGVLLGFGWVEGVRTLLRVFAAILLMVPIAQFAVQFLYFKMRDSMWGAFGSRKSLAKVLLLDASIALAVIGSFLGLIGVAMWDRTKVAESLVFCSVAGVVAGIAWLLIARFSGPAEIRDTLWACLDLDSDAKLKSA